MIDYNDVNNVVTPEILNETPEQTVARLKAQKLVQEKRKRVLALQEERKRIEREQV